MNEFPAFVTMAFSRIVAILRTRSAFRNSHSQQINIVRKMRTVPELTHKQSRERLRLEVKYVLQ